MVYIGVSEKGAYAVVNGNKAEVRRADKDDFLPFMLSQRGMETRCVVEMSRPEYETASKDCTFSELAYKVCRSFNLPCMVVKPKVWQRDMGVKGNAADMCRRIYPGIEIETRSDGSRGNVQGNAEVDALLLAEYARRSR